MDVKPVHVYLQLSVAGNDHVSGGVAANLINAMLMVPLN
jgi:hypothetical protein